MWSLSNDVGYPYLSNHIDQVKRHLKPKVEINSHESYDGLLSQFSYLLASM